MALPQGSIRAVNPHLVLDLLLLLTRFVLNLRLLALAHEVGHPLEMYLVNLSTVIVRTATLLVVTHDRGQLTPLALFRPLRLPQAVAAVLAVPFVTLRPPSSLVLRLVLLMLVLVVLLVARHVRPVFSSTR